MTISHSMRPAPLSAISRTPFPNRLCRTAFATEPEKIGREVVGSICPAVRWKRHDISKVNAAVLGGREYKIAHLVWSGFGRSLFTRRLGSGNGAEMHGVMEPPASKVRAPLAATHYVYGARALRDFGVGYTAVLLPVYLTALGLGPLKVGVIATLALFGSALTTLAVGFLGARADQRRLLIAALAS
jgi:hypothetical protein